MFLKKINTPGIAHLSYVGGDGGEAFVIDPRRDVDVYLNAAHREGCRITHKVVAVGRRRHHPSRSRSGLRLRRGTRGS